MLERMLLPRQHAISILLRDHDSVKRLFHRFERAKSAAEKETILRDAVMELKIHATIEEEIFYPTVRAKVGADLMNEADEEHHVARVLIAELDNGRRGDEHRQAKFMVLAESVRHHIKEEEGEVLPKARALKIDFEELGRQMLRRKAELKHDGIPPDREHAMVEAAGGGHDTPARTARRRRPARRRSRTAKAKRTTTRRRVA
jgi:hemerythrin-like domain-containing protein